MMPQFGHINEYVAASAVTDRQTHTHTIDIIDYVNGIGNRSREP